MNHRIPINFIYRCVSNGQNGYTRYEFSCGPGTVWDVNSVTCNYPSAVSGNCHNVDLSNETILTAVSKQNILEDY